MDDEGLRLKTQVASPAELAAAREARGMSQLDISQRIKLQVKQVNALEEGQWEALPGKSFVRGALRSYGKLLDVDVAPLLESIGGFAEPAQVQGMKPLDAPLSRSSGLGFNGGGRGSPILWVIAGLIGVVALVLYFGSDTDSSRIRSWLPSSEKPAGTGSDSATPATPATPAAPGSPSGSTPAPASDGGASTTPATSVGTSVGSSGSGNGSTYGSASAPSAAVAGPSGAAASSVEGTARPAVVLSDLQGLPQNGSNGSAAGAQASGQAASGGPPPSGGAGSNAGASGGASGSFATDSGNAGKALTGGTFAAAAGSHAGSATDSTLAARGPAAPAPLAAAKPVESAASPATAPVADLKGVMQVGAKQDAWIEIREADGTALHNGLLKAGASIELKGSPPYRVVLGNASHVELSYEGKPQDLAPHIRANNIARLQLR